MKENNFYKLYNATNYMYYDYINTFEDIENDEIIEEMKDTIKCFFCDWIGIDRTHFKYYDYLEHIVNYFNLKTKLCINTPIPQNLRELLTQEYKLQEMLQAA